MCEGVHIKMDLTVGNCFAEGNFTIMNDKDVYISLGDNFKPYETLEIHLVSKECRLSRVVGDGGLSTIVSIQI